MAIEANTRAATVAIARVVVAGDVITPTFNARKAGTFSLC